VGVFSAREEKHVVLRLLRRWCVAPFVASRKLSLVYARRFVTEAPVMLNGAWATPKIHPLQRLSCLQLLSGVLVRLLTAEAAAAADDTNATWAAALTADIADGLVALIAQSRDPSKKPGDSSGNPGDSSGNPASETAVLWALDLLESVFSPASDRHHIAVGSFPVDHVDAKSDHVDAKSDHEDAKSGQPDSKTAGKNPAKLLEGATCMPKSLLVTSAIFVAIRTRGLTVEFRRQLAVRLARLAHTPGELPADALAQALQALEMAGKERVLKSGLERMQVLQPFLELCAVVALRDLRTLTRPPDAEESDAKVAGSKSAEAKKPAGVFGDFRSGLDLFGTEKSGAEDVKETRNR
jgi:hypothetical protein